MSIEWISQLREIVVDSLEKSWLPFPFKEDLCEGWKKDLQVGPSYTILYTSCMYHIAPVIEKAVENLEKFGVTKGGVMARLASVGTKALGGFLLRPEEAEVKRANAIVRRIYELLRRAGVEFGLLDREIYSGALLYELGLVDDFARYARRAAEYFKKRGVRRIITVDPHTQHVLEKIYPKYVEGFDVEVVSYLDLIKPGGVSINGFAIHDSCLYARFLGKYERIRQFVAASNPVEDPYITGKDTAGCCGGPIESTFPGVAKQIAKARVRELAKLSRKVVVQCPICYVNLKRVSEGEVELYHMAEVLL